MAFFTIKREKAPFVFTPQFAAILQGEGSKEYVEFEELACSAYLLLRKKANLLISLFLLMLPSQVPELKVASDVEYMREQLRLELSETEAKQHFKVKIKECLNCITQQLMEALHNVKHRSGKK